MDGQRLVVDGGEDRNAYPTTYSARPATPDNHSTRGRSSVLWVAIPSARVIRIPSDPSASQQQQQHRHTTNVGRPHSGRPSLRLPHPNVEPNTPATSTLPMFPLQAQQAGRSPFSSSSTWQEQSQTPTDTNSRLRAQQRRRRRRNDLSLTATTSGTTRRIRRLLLRPAAVLLMGFCMLQAFFSKDFVSDSVRVDDQEVPCGNSILQRFAVADSADDLAFSMVSPGVDRENVASDSSDASPPSSPSIYSSSSSIMQQSKQLPPYPGLIRHETHFSSNDRRDNDEDNGTADHNDVESSIGAQSSQVYGWEPTSYPDPLIHPLECGIAYLDQDNKLPSSANSEADEATEPILHDVSPVPHFDNPAHLRLCDPDWVLGIAYLEQIAAELRNFSRTFSEEFFANKEWNNQGRRALQRLSYSANGSSEGRARHPKSRKNEMILPTIELAVATVRKMNVASVLSHGSYFTYEDEDDMVSDAAQIFARYLHDAWWRSDCSGDPDDCDSDRAEYGILIFLSIQDRVCFISTGSAVSVVLPWWRLEHIISSMKPDLRHRDYGHALLTAIKDLSRMLEAGPPTIKDRLHDFLSRFGVVIGFAVFTFCFGAWGEYRDRRKRWQYAESRSQLTPIEMEKARMLQKEFRTRTCPICLDPFVCDDNGDVPSDTLHNRSSSHDADNNRCDDEDNDTDADDEGHSSLSSKKRKAQSPSLSSCSPKLRRVDTYGIPLCGSDNRRIKMLRCGHIFCDTCWKNWVHSGYGNPCFCPVCRQDVGKPTNKRRRRDDRDRSNSSGNGSNNSGSRRQNRSRSAHRSSSHSVQDTIATHQARGLSHPSYDAIALAFRSTSNSGRDNDRNNTRTSPGGWRRWLFSNNDRDNRPHTINRDEISNNEEAPLLRQARRRDRNQGDFSESQSNDNDSDDTVLYGLYV